AALFLAEATGAVEATVALSHTEGRQNADATATVRDFRMGETRVGRADVQAAIVDLFNVPAIDGTVSAETLVAGGVEVSTLAATAQSNGGTTRFQANAMLENGAEARTRGSLSPEGEGWRLGLEEASFGRGLIAARL